MSDYIKTLKDDLVEQFKDKEKILSLVSVLGEQLDAVHLFYEQLLNERVLNNAVGKQLDGIGEIVALSRAEATQLAKKLEGIEEITDDIYRKYLVYKILKNTCNSTYYDIMNAINMFWDGPPIKYSEDFSMPATILLDYEAEGDYGQKAANIPIIRPGGVGVKMSMKKNDDATIYFGIAKREYVKMTLECATPVFYLVDENSSRLLDENGAYLTE